MGIGLDSIVGGLAQGGLVKRAVDQYGDETRVRDWAIEDRGRLQQDRAYQDQQRAVAAQTAQMGLEDATKARGRVNAYEQVFAAGGSLSDMAGKAREQGDVNAFQQFTTLQRQLEQQGAADAIKEVMMFGDPKRAVAAFNRVGSHKWDDDAQVVEQPVQGGGTRKMLITKTNGQPNPPIDIARTAQMLGLTKAPEFVSMGGRSAIDKHSGQIVHAPAEGGFDLKGDILFNKNTGQWTQVVSKDADWHLGSITHGDTEIPVAINRKTGEVQQLGPGGQRTGLSARVTMSNVPGQPPLVSIGQRVYEFKPSTEAKPGETSWFGADKPGTPAAPARLAPAEIPTGASPPVPGARQGRKPDGSPGWFVQKDGKWNLVDSGPSAPTTTAAAPAPAPAAPARSSAPPVPASSTAGLDSAGPPASAARPVASGGGAPGNEATAIIQREGMPGLLARLERLYPPTEQRTGRGGAARRIIDHPEIAALKALSGPALAQKANELLAQARYAGQAGGL